MGDLKTPKAGESTATGTPQSMTQHIGLPCVAPTPGGDGNSSMPQTTAPHRSVVAIESSLCRSLQQFLKDPRLATASHLNGSGRADSPRIGLGIAFSGGADSTVLARLLTPRALRAQHRVVLLHVHHGWQRQADQWAERAGALAQELGIDCQVLRVQLQARGLGWEAEARTQRKLALQRAARELGLASIWLAHHADDQAETILQRLCRGTGLEGLQAMQAWREQEGLWWIRPWLHQRAQAIRALARARQWSWVEDPSNAQTTFARGHLRAQVLPELTRHWPQAPRALARVAEQMQMLWPWVEQQVEQALATCLRGLDAPEPRIDTSMDALSVGALLRLDPALQPWVLRAWLNRAAGQALAQHERIQQVLEFLQRSSQRRRTWRFAGVRGTWVVQLRDGLLQIDHSA